MHYYNYAYCIIRNMCLGGYMPSRFSVLKCGECIHVACLGACVRHLEGGTYHNVNCEDYSLQHLQQGHDNIHLSGLTCRNQNTSQYES